MNAEEIYTKLAEIRTIVESFADPAGTLQVDAVRVKVALEFCATEIQKALEKGLHQSTIQNI